MLTMVTQTTRRSVSAVAAMAIVFFAGLTFEQGHMAAAPHGTVEVGELTMVGLEKLAHASLPEIVVTAGRSVQLATAQRADTDPAQHGQGRARGQPFGGHVEQFHAAFIEGCKNLLGFFCL